MNKYEEAIEKLVDSYDAFYFENKYSDTGGTHSSEFRLLEDLKTKDNKVANALAWIKHEYDCYYKKSLDTKEGPFEYLRNIARNQND